ncbi:L-glutamate gamma-semialdehyde dehydrogenase [Brevibacillus agri]|uniref:L-glutamate gamma-semialdehyde dehydrogenase n=1 Tax=Brevibacillus agri TaxID=51101 RepID=UPI000472948F|nr:L-glutamate gamma-semialdehyde dehydrogenase [Brevibacillus agri]MED4571569.1 L-glutamate gamma-semialdehyde dehydrogenase [Brevibacillus agri]
MTVKRLEDFVNEPTLDFTKPEHVREMKDALSKVEQELGREFPLHIGSEKIMTDKKITSINPGQVDQVIGYMSSSSQELAEKAMNTALSTFETWKHVPAAERASYLFRAAELLRQRRYEFSAWLILESGKNYEEADGEVAEAIDFMEYYGRAMLKLDEDEHGLTKIAGENNRLTFIPLGVGVVIPPWNFPLAICVGLTVSAVVTGNTVLLKPASVTPIIAYQFVKIMEEAGLPSGVINFIPGSSKEIGDYLTAHPQTRFISFTGSKDVGLHINKIAGQTAPGQKWIKRVNAEMGGKDGIVVDETANLEAAATAVVESAFSFQGQKCSAGSRLIAVASIYDQLVEKVVERTKQLAVGAGSENYPVGPVIDRSAYERILEYMEIGKAEGRLLCGGEKAEGNGYYLKPTIIAEVVRNSRIMQEEIFGPVLAVAKAQDWKEAIEIYNDTEYGLTGSFFSQEQDRLDYAVAHMHCGNLYLNRKCTGALVGVHPFGGFNMSGTDSKSGSYDYLKLFTQGKLYTQKQ